MAVTPGSIVEHFDVLEDICLREIASSVDLSSDSLLFQAAEERFSDRVVPTVPSPTHAGIELVRFAEADPGIAAVLRSLVGVHDLTRCFGFRLQTAMSKASKTRSRASVGCIDHPMIIRLWRSMTTARYNQPSHVRMYVMSVTHATSGRSTVNCRCNRFGAMIDGILTTLRGVL